MKKFTKFSFFFFLLIVLSQSCTKDIVPNPETLNTQYASQATILDENFDAALALPSGWVAVGDSGWNVDSTGANSSINYAGASGKNNVEVSNPVSSGPYTCTLTSASISTVGYSNITILYGARRSKHFSDNGSSITNLAFSTNGGTTWTNIPYTENPGDSNWYLINNGARIPLAVGAANQAGVLFRWTANVVATASGTYRIDDFQVFGTKM